MSAQLSWSDSFAGGTLEATDEEGAIAYLWAGEYGASGGVSVSAADAEAIVEWLTARLAECGRPAPKGKA